MKIVKRDGRIVDYDANKIILAISKANEEVEDSKRITDKQIAKIIEYIESLNKKRILVEDIQDIIEQKLMEYKKYELAKTYIIYRHNRALIRKSNHTDENILGIIRNQNKQMIGDSYKKNSLIATAQRDIVAGEISKDITKRVLLPEKIIKAHEEGIIYFHDMDYFIHSIFNSSYVNIDDMLKNGTVMNGKLIESPKSFQVACNVTTQILSQVASGQYGGQTIDVSHLSPYLKKSYTKIKDNLYKLYKKTIDKEFLDQIIIDKTNRELSNGIQTLLYQINTLMTTNGRSPLVTLFLYLNEQDENINETAKIILEIIKQYEKGIKNAEGVYVTPEYPKIVYVLTKNNHLNKKYGYITEEFIKCANNCENITIVSEYKMSQLFDGFVYGPLANNIFLAPYKDNDSYKIEGRFNQGMVSLNLVDAAISSNSAEKKFFDILDERVDLALEALMCRYRALLNVISDVSPIHWQHGAITRLVSNEKIDNFLKNGYSNLILGYSGLEEASQIIDANNKIAVKTKIIHFINEKLRIFYKANNIFITLYNNIDVGYNFAEKDLEKYGLIKNITDKDCYDLRNNIDLNDLTNEIIIQDLSKGGYSLYISGSDINEENLEKIYKNIWYVEVKGRNERN